MALIGEKSGLTFQLAGRVRVRVARVDLETSKIDFTLVDETTGGGRDSARPRFAEPLSRDSLPRGKKRR